MNNPEVSITVLNSIIKNIGVESILMTIGVSYQKKGDNYWFSSPFREDKKPSMILYTENFFCIDFAGDWKGSLFKLFRELTGESLFNYFNIGNTFLMDKTFENVLQKEKKRDSFKDLTKVEIKQSGASPEPVNLYPKALEYCEVRGITKEAIDYFKIEYAENCIVNNTSYVSRLCIPIEHEGSLISYEGRDITGEAPRKVLYPKKSSVGTLFNFDRLDLTQPVVVVEGLMDLIRVWIHITKNVTTPFGVWLTDTQEQLFNQIPHIILLPDRDKGGDTLISKFDEFYQNEFYIATLPVEGSDPGDALIEDIKSSIDSRISATKYFMKKYEVVEDRKEASASEWSALL